MNDTKFTMIVSNKRCVSFIFDARLKPFIIVRSITSVKHLRLASETGKSVLFISEVQHRNACLHAFGETDSLLVPTSGLVQSGVRILWSRVHADVPLSRSIHWFVYELLLLL